MAAAGPRGRDGPSPREFTAVRHFMMADLGLSGLPLLVYARIFGFCDAGCGYFESKGGLAWIGNTYLDDSGRDSPASLNSTGDM